MFLSWYIYIYRERYIYKRWNLPEKNTILLKKTEVLKNLKKCLLRRY